MFPETLFIVPFTIITLILLIFLSELHVFNKRHIEWKLDEQGWSKSTFSNHKAEEWELSYNVSLFTSVLIEKK